MEMKCSEPCNHLASKDVTVEIAQLRCVRWSWIAENAPLPENRPVEGSLTVQLTRLASFKLVKLANPTTPTI